MNIRWKFWKKKHKPELMPPYKWLYGRIKITELGEDWVELIKRENSVMYFLKEERNESV